MLSSLHRSCVCHGDDSQQHSRNSTHEFGECGSAAQGHGHQRSFGLWLHGSSSSANVGRCHGGVIHAGCSWWRRSVDSTWTQNGRVSIGSILVQDVDCVCWTGLFRRIVDDCGNAFSRTSVLSPQGQICTGRYEESKIQSSRRRPHDTFGCLRSLESVQIQQPVVFWEFYSSPIDSTCTRRAQATCDYHGSVQNGHCFCWQESSQD